MRRRFQWGQGLLVGALIVLVLWLGSLIWNLFGKAELAWQKEHEAKAEYAALEARKASLQADINELQTPRGQDAAIREAFGVAKPGEEVIVVVPPASSTPTATPSWWRQALDWF